MAGVMSVRTASETSNEDYTISRLLQMDNGLSKFAAEQLPQYIKLERDYKGFAGEVLVRHPITSDQLHTIDGNPCIEFSKDLNAEACFMGMDDEFHGAPVRATTVNVPITIVGTHEMTIHKMILMTQKYAYLERVKELSGQAIMKLEDQRVLYMAEKLLLGNSTDKVNPQYLSQVQTFTDTTLDKSHLVALKKIFSRNQVDLGFVLCNPATLDDMLAWNNQVIDQLTMREVFENGVKYAIWGSIKIKPSIMIPEGVLYGMSSPDKNGRIPELLPLTIELTNTTNRLQKGLLMYEFIGFYLNSHKAIGKVMLNHTPSTAVIQDDLYNGFKATAKKYNFEVGFGSVEEGTVSL